MIKILNDDFKVIDILRKYTFMQYEECFREIGSFKINAQITETNLFLLEKKKFYVLFDNDIFGEITKVEKDSDGEYEKTILIEGKMSLILLTRRVINSIIKFKGKTYQLVNELIVQNLTNDETSKRYVNIDLKYDNEEYLQTISSEVNKQLTGGYVWDNIYDLLEQDKMGIIFNPIVEPTKIINDIETNITSWEMKISAGVDRRKGNIYNNEAVVFSQSLSNIQRTAYNYETGDYKNVAYVAGEGEGTNRKWYEIYVSDEESKEQKGWKRKELWIDARDIQSEDGEKQLTDEEYETLIKQRANEKFPENSEIESYTATIVESNKQFIYGKDYFLGDLVTVIDNELGIEIDAQVTKVIISEQGNRRITDTEFTYGTIKRNPIEEIKIINKSIEKHENDIKYLENKIKKISKESYDIIDWIIIESSKDIQSIIDNITDNSIVYFKKGRYEVEKIDIDSKNNITFLLDEATIICTGNYFIKANKCNDIKIIGGNISGANEYGISVNDCLRPLFKRVNVNNCGSNSTKETTGIRIFGDCSGFSIENCYISNISSGIISSDGYIHAYGIFINRMSSSNTYSKYGKISECIIDNIYGIDSDDKKADGDGIFVQNPPYLNGNKVIWRELTIIVEKCTLTNCKKRGFKSASVGITIRDCRFIGEFYGSAIDFQYGHGKVIDCYIENKSNYTGATTCGIVTTEGGVELKGCTIICEYNGGYQNGFRVNPRLSASVIDDSVKWDKIIINDCYFNKVENAVNISANTDVSYNLKALEIINCRFGIINAANIISMGKIFSTIDVFKMIDFQFDAGNTRESVKNVNSKFTYPAVVFSNTTECCEIYSRYWIDAPIAGNAIMPTSYHTKIIFAGDLSGIKYKEYTAHGSRIYGTRDPNTTTATLAKQLLYNSKKGDLYFDIAEGSIYKCTTAGTDSNIGTWTVI